MKLTTTIIFLLSATSALACGNGECEPNPEPEPESPVVVEKPSLSSGVGSDYIYEPYSRQYYAICTCDEFKVAWGFESLELRTAKARSQCEIRRTERLNCPMKWK